MGRTDPAEVWAAVTPSDSVDLPRQRCRGIYVTGAGDVACVGANDAVSVFAFQAGEIKPLGPIRINSTNTTATGIIALY